MKTVIKKARKGQYERKYRTTGKTGPASECVTKKMEKPTAQELWEKICKSLDWEYSPDGVWEKLEDQYTRELIQQYAQTYHEEQMMKQVVVVGEPLHKNPNNQPNQ